MIGRKYKKRKSEDSDDESNKTIQDSTVIQYKSAITKLYTQQKIEGRNNTEHPKLHPILGPLIRKVKHDAPKTARKNLVDRGKHTLIDGYSNSAEFRAICDYFWSAEAGKSGIRNGSMFRYSHYGVLRGQNVRIGELADTFSWKIPADDAPHITPPIALMMSMRQGKTNQFGKLEYCSMVRARDVNVCGVSGYAFHLFDRFQLRGESLPIIEDPAQWYFDKVRDNQFNLDLSWIYWKD